MVKDILKCYTESTQKELKDIADEAIQELSFKLEKTAIPRPTVLGNFLMSL